MNKDNNNGYAYDIFDGYDSIGLYFEQACAKEPPSPEEEKDLCLRAKTGDESAHLELIERNTRFVVNIAKEYTDRGLPMLDLIQEGNIGLMKAIERFNQIGESRLANYASSWIRQGITRAIANQSKTIKIPVHRQEAGKKINRIMEMEGVVGWRSATEEELSESIGIPLKRIKMLLSSRKQTHTPYLGGIIDYKALKNRTSNSWNDDNNTPHIAYSTDWLVDENTTDPRATIERELENIELDKCLETLDQQERKVIDLIFGLKGGEPKSQRETAYECHVSDTRVGQIKRKALRELRVEFSRQRALSGREREISKEAGEREMERQAKGLNTLAP